MTTEGQLIKINENKAKFVKNHIIMWIESWSKILQKTPNKLLVKISGNTS